MKNSNEISVIILTYNEEIHLERCIKSLQPFVKEIYVVDSFSTDKTREISEKYGAKFYQNKWINYAKQFQWGLDNCPISTKWVMRMDADEYIEPKLANYLNKFIEEVPSNITGIYLKRKTVFMNKWIKWGFYPHILLRIWNHKYGRIEQRWMDEHIVLSQGETKLVDIADIVDDNKNDFTWWVTKHNAYATREMLDIMNIKYHFMPIDESLKENDDPQAKYRRVLKERLYSKLPLGLRSLVYFCYRYFLKLGFLNGFRGFIYHFMQAFWYRMLVDVKCYEFERKAKLYNNDFKIMIMKEYGFEI